MLAMLSATASFALRSRSRQITIGVCVAELVLSAVTLAYTLSTGSSFVYTMGRVSAPWGNEIRAGALEALFALMFSGILLFSITGGLRDINRDIPNNKEHFFFVMISLLLGALLAVTYTNDIFTAYVFIDIITISACSIITIKPGGKPLIATMLYLIMLSISLLYAVTGHLLMEPLHGAVQALAAAGSYTLPLFVLFALMAVGLTMKSALFPFHVWLPGAHASATTASSSILSGLIIKCYLIFLLKVICRVLGPAVAAQIHVGYAADLWHSGNDHRLSVRHPATGHQEDAFLLHSGPDRVYLHRHRPWNHCRKGGGLLSHSGSCCG